MRESGCSGCEEEYKQEEGSVGCSIHRPGWDDGGEKSWISSIENTEPRVTPIEDVKRKRELIQVRRESIEKSLG